MTVSTKQTQVKSPAVTIRTNDEKNGIEIAFAKKPYSGMLAILKENGFRWHRRNKFWYARQSCRAWAVARDVADRCGVEMPRQPETT
jgi:ribosomal protein L19